MASADDRYGNQVRDEADYPVVMRPRIPRVLADAMAAI
jgi:hypothetical protein